MRAMGLSAPMRALSLAVPLFVVTACGMTTSNSEYCDPGDYILGPPLADGGVTYARCLGDGSAYVTYGGPDPNDVPDANVPDTGASCSTAGGQKLGFMCAGCTSTSSCGTYEGIQMDCAPFPNKGGNLCSIPCTAATVCGPPSAGCGNSGYCKP
jgi:hypothetical protein